MQRFIIKRVIHVVALVLVGGQMDRVIAADTVVLIQNATGNEAHRVQHDSVTDSVLLEKLEAKGIERFLAYEIPLDLAKARYGGHFVTVFIGVRLAAVQAVVD